MSEWLKEAVLKTARSEKLLVGSNPTPSAKNWLTYLKNEKEKLFALSFSHSFCFYELLWENFRTIFPKKGTPNL